MKKGISKTTISFIILTVLIMLEADAVFAASLVRITSPADGSTVWAETKTPITTSFSGAQTSPQTGLISLLQDISPMTVQVLKDNVVIDEQVVKTYSVGDSNITPPRSFASVTLPSEGWYTIRVRVRGNYGSWNSVDVYAKSSSMNSNESDTVDNTLQDVSWVDPMAKVPTKIKVSKTVLSRGKKVRVKISSNSGSKIIVKGKNTKAKNSKYVLIKSGKTATLTFKKNAPKGKYTFLITSAAKGRYKKVKKTITIKVK